MSMTATSSPRSLRCAASHWPTKPLPPVISARIRGTLLRGRPSHRIGTHVLRHARLPRVLRGDGDAQRLPLRSHGPASSAARSAPAKAPTSPGGTSSAAPPATSAMAVPSVVTSGAPQASASRAGKAESLLEGGVGDDRGPTQQRRHGPVGEVAGADDPVAVAGRRQRALGLGHPPAGLAPEHQHGVGVGIGHPVERGHQRRHPLARLERADEDDQRAVGRHAQRAHDGARSAPSAGSVGANRSWSTPCGATTTGARTSQQSRSRSAVTWLTQTSTPARSAARRMARRKKAALERRCHSGWSKKVQSWIVTAHGTGDRAGIV